MHRKFIFLLLTSVLALVGSLQAHAGEEADGIAAEQAGKLREALPHYVAALQSATDGSADEQRLREKIIALVQKLDPPPTVLDDAVRFLARGGAAVKDAQNSTDLAAAAEEFIKALRVAPWLVDVYYNLGVVLDKAGKYAEAIRNLKYYLLAAPKADDTKEVQSLIFEIEYRQEKRLKTDEKQRETALDEKQGLDSWAGTWTFAGKIHKLNNHADIQHDSTARDYFNVDVDIHGRASGRMIRCDNTTQRWDGTANETNMVLKQTSGSCNGEMSITKFSTGYHAHYRKHDSADQATFTELYDGPVLHSH